MTSSSPQVRNPLAASPSPSAEAPASKQHHERRPRSRRKAPKVKTGCLTCRVRRVKCDETHPTCQRCQKLAISCTYPTPVEKLNHRAHQGVARLVPLVPKERVKSTPLARVREVRAGPRFTDEMEARYFVYYCEGISSQIGGPFKSKLWDQLIPQAGEEVPFIGRAVIALGALSKSQSSPSKARNWESGNKEIDEERGTHRQYALTQYIFALKGMRKSIKEKPNDVRTALIGCLLIFCFESLQGHQGAASAHASSGSTLIMNMCTLCQPKSWRDSKLGAELYSAFSSLNLQSLLFVDGRTKATHRYFKGGLSAAAALMPEELEDLGECRRYWHYIMRRNLHFGLEVRDSLSSTSSPEEFVNLGSNDSPWVDRTSNEAPTSSFLLAERDLYVQDICRWEIASAPLFCRLFNSSSQIREDFLVACLLRIHAAMNIVLLTRAFNPSEEEYDKFIDQFRTIVDLSGKIHLLLVGREGEGGEGGGRVFRFEIGILPALSQVSLLCRERDIRGRAIDLLKRSKGYKEGIWDADGVGAVGEWVRDLEEEGLGEREVVAQKKRVQLVGCDMKVEARLASVIVRQADGRERDGVVRW